MKKRYWIFTLSLVAVVFLVEYDVARRMNQKNLAMKIKAAAPARIVVATPKPETPVKPVVEDHSSFFESDALKQAQKLSSLQNNPQVVDSKLDKIAKDLNSIEMKKLAIVVGRKDENQDRRAMAIELLSRAKNKEGLDLLKEFVLSPPNAAAVTPRSREFESVLRAQAVEGIAAYPKKDLALSYLDSLANQVDESFLKDRIVRSEEGLKGRAPTNQQPDEAALKQLVQ